MPHHDTTGGEPEVGLNPAVIARWLDVSRRYLSIDGTARDPVRPARVRSSPLKMRDLGVVRALALSGRISPSMDGNSRCLSGC